MMDCCDDQKEEEEEKKMESKCLGIAVHPIDMAGK